MEKVKPLMLKPKDAAELLQVSMPTMYQICRIDGFPVVHIGRRILIPIDALKEWLNKAAKENCVI